MRSLAVLNQGNYQFKLDTLPLGVQASPLMSGYFDAESGYALLGGNFYPVNVQRGRYDASWGSILKFDPEENTFDIILPSSSGLSIQGEIREILPIKIKGKNISYSSGTMKNRKLSLSGISQENNLSKTIRY